MLGHESTLSKMAIDKLAKNYGISDMSNCRAPRKEEYISNPKPREIVVTIVHLKGGFRLPFHPFFVWMIKKFWIQPNQFLPNS